MNRLATKLLLSCLAAGLMCSVCSPILAQGGADTAEAIVPTANAALAEGDLDAVVALIDPVDQPRVVAHSLGFCQGVAAGQGEMEAFNELVAANGLQPLLEPDGPYAQGIDETRAFFDDKDAAAILTQVLAFAGEVGGPDWLRIMVIPEGDCAGLALEGDSGRCSIDGQEVRLVEHDGRWFLDLDYPE